MSGLVLIWVLLVVVNGQQLSDLSGEDIIGVMQVQGDKCPATTPDGQNWAPLPKGSACGSKQRCDFPNQWCAFKMKADQTPDLASLNCKPLADTCKQAFQALAGGGGTGATSAPGATTLTPAGSTGSAGTGSTGSSMTGSTGTSPMITSQTDSTAATSPTPGEITSMSTVSTISEASTTVMGMVTQPIMTELTSTAGTLIGGGGTGENSPVPGEVTPATPATPSGVTAGPPPPGSCCDYHEYCCFWAATGECDVNRHFMNHICPKSCGTCNCNGNPSCQSKVDSRCSGPNTPPGPVCQCSTGSMVNRDWNPKCSMWAGHGECDKNASYMKAICKISCNVCR